METGPHAWQIALFMTEPREKSLEILTEIRPEVDYGTATDYVAEGLLDSTDIVSLVASLDEAYGISIEGTEILLDRGWSAEKVLNEALVEGMRIVGVDFRDGILFVPEVLLAANAMKGGMEILRPLLAESGIKPMGKMVIGTVKGDIHDIGKNLVAMMMEGAGFEVVALDAAAITRAPSILPSSTAASPTLPAAPSTSSVSPAWRPPRILSP